MPDRSAESRIRLNFDLDAPGRRFGDFKLRWPDNTNSLGYHPIPAHACRDLVRRAEILTLIVQDVSGGR